MMHDANNGEHAMTTATYEIQQHTMTSPSGRQTLTGYVRLVRNGVPVTAWVEPEQAESTRREIERCTAAGSLREFAGGFLGALHRKSLSAPDPELVRAWEEIYGGPWSDEPLSDAIDGDDY